MVPDSLTHRVMFGNAASNDDFIGLVQRDAQGVQVRSLGWTVTRFSADSWPEGVGEQPARDCGDHGEKRVTNPHEVLGCAAGGPNRVTSNYQMGAIGLATKEAIYPTHGPRR